MKSISRDSATHEIGDFLTAAHAYIIKDKRVLLGKRLKQDEHVGKWATFGGIIKKGETPQEALYRELQEELGIEIINPEYVDKSEDKSGHEIQFFIIRNWKGQPKNLKEHSEIKWFDYSEIPRIPMVNYVRDIMHKYLEKDKAKKNTH